jgi:F-box protein 11
MMKGFPAQLPMCQNPNVVIGRVMIMPDKPAAFMIYVQFDDQHDDGQLTQFRERLSMEVRAQTGEKFTIFHEGNDFAWEQDWQHRIHEASETVTLLVVIITPSLFRSSACRADVQRFLKWERNLGRQDLIMPVYYISARDMDVPWMRDADEMARMLASRQYVDWRELRFEPFTSLAVRKAIAQLAARLGDTFWQPLVVPGRRQGVVQEAGSLTGSAEHAVRAGPVTVETEPGTHVVDAYQRGDFATISAAIKAAKPGDRILVRPGLYEEGLVVDKPLEILGDGPVPEIVVQAANASALQFNSSTGRVANLTLRQAGGGEWYGVDIMLGQLDLEGCDIASQTLACIAIQKGANPTLRRNQIHDGNHVGVLVQDSGLGMLEDNDIFGNALSGVEIATGANPTLRRNQIHDGKAGGVLVRDSGLGTLEDNDIFGNVLSGVEIATGANPTLRRNQIHDGRAGGVYVRDSGLGMLEDNDIFGNAFSGVEVATGADPTLHRNKLHDGKAGGILVWNSGLGMLEDNDIIVYT